MNSFNDIITGSGGGGCFIAGTRVLTPNGYKNIKDILVGDLVIAFDDIGRLHESKVLETNSHDSKDIFEYRLWGGGSLVATPNHWVLTSENTFCEIGDINEHRALVNSHGTLVPIISSKFLGTATVYNLIVDKFHTYIANDIRVHNGGGGDKGGSHTPTEAPDTLRSVSYAQVLDLLCEGEIEGLTTGDAKSIYLNGTAVQNLDNSYNFSDFQFTFQNGTQYQPYIPGFDSVEAEVTVGEEVKYNLPKTITITDPTVDRVRVTIGVSSLVKYEDNGDTNGSSISYKISIRKNSLTFIDVVNKTITGKTTSKYQTNHIITLPRTLETDYFDITVTRLTVDSTTLKLQNTTIFDSYTKISDVKLRYPNSVLCGIKIDSSQFSSIPTRGYDVKLLKVKVPSNYNPLTRTYTGIWDGTFSAATWTDNPAWCFYDLVTNERYGLGEYIDPSYVDKWSLYTISQYCDELISDGYGGLEPRFTLNVYIQTREEAIKLLTDLATAFRGMVYWGDGTITFAQDSYSSTPILQFNNSNVIDGVFTYSGASKKVIHTAALVSWNDPDSLYKQKVEYVEDRDAIDRYGYNPTEIVAFGCTSRGQAHRVGKWLLYTERVESNVVTFSAGMESSYCRPGNIIKVFDHTRVGQQWSGRVLSIVSNNQAELDRPILVDNSKTYYIRFTTILNGKFNTEEYLVTAINDSTVSISGNLDTTVAPNTIWSIRTSGINEELFRIISLKETDSVGIYSIVAMLHDPNKYNIIENNIVFEDKKYTTLSEIPSQVPLESIKYIDALYLDSTGAINTYLDIAFPSIIYASSYSIELKKDNSNWEVVQQNLKSPKITIYNLVDNSYYSIRVTPYNVLGIAGPSTIISNILVKGKSVPPSDIPWIFINGNDLTFGKVLDLDLAGYRVKSIVGHLNNNWSSAQTIYDLLQNTSCTVEGFTGNTTIMVKAVDTSGNESINPAIISSVLLGSSSSNVIEVIDEKALGFRGSKTTNLGLDTNENLETIESSTNYMWNIADPLVPMYKINSSSNFYANMFFEEASYTTVYYTPARYIRSGTYGILYLNYLINSAAMDITYSIVGNNLVWNQDTSDLGFWTNDQNYVYNQSLPEFIPYTNIGIKITEYTGDIIFNFKFKANTSRSTISKLEIITDMPDIVNYYNDINIVASGTRITAAIGIYNSITSIVATLQAGAAQATHVKILDKNNSLGPLIQCFDISGNPIDGIVDLVIKGY